MSKYRHKLAVISLTLISLGGLLTMFSPQLFGKSAVPAALEGIVGDPKNGEYVLRMSGCVACHTDIDNEGEFLAGGPAIETNFGRFYAPNITPDMQNGIGGWSLNDMYDALTSGISPENEHYYPVFPYTSYHKLKRQDIADLKAYLDLVTPSSNVSQAHELSWPISERRLLGVWKWLNFNPIQPDKKADNAAELSRGKYLVDGPGHCGECHSARNILGGTDQSMPLTGNLNGPDGNPVPAIIGPDADIKHWDKLDLMFYLQTGIQADGDAAGGAMSEVIFESTSYLEDDDVEAIAAYLLKKLP